MAVVINELEVAPAALPTPKGETPGGGASGGAEAKTMREIEKRLRREHERALRLRAH